MNTPEKKEVEADTNQTRPDNVGFMLRWIRAQCSATVELCNRLTEAGVPFYDNIPFN